MADRSQRQDSRQAGQGQRPPPGPRAPSAGGQPRQGGTTLALTRSWLLALSVRQWSACGAQLTILRTAGLHTRACRPAGFTIMCQRWHDDGSREAWAAARDVSALKALTPTGTHTVTPEAPFPLLQLPTTAAVEDDLEDCCRCRAKQAGLWPAAVRPAGSACTQPGSSQASVSSLPSGPTAQSACWAGAADREAERSHTPSCPSSCCGRQQRCTDSECILLAGAAWLRWQGVQEPGQCPSLWDLSEE